MRRTFDNTHQQAVYDSWYKKIDGADLDGAGRLLDEIQGDPIYQNPSDPDHFVFLHLVPAALGRQMELSGDDPHGHGSPLVPGIDRKDFDDTEDYENGKARARLESTVQELQGDPDVMPNEIEGVQVVLDGLYEAQAERDKIADIQNTRMDELEAGWVESENAQHAKMRKDFFETRMRNVLPSNHAEELKVTEQLWRNLANSWGW